jgi:alginate O-acetyltransferase complex protein AlgI
MARTYLNLMIVMTLGGLWHGASLSYALWGLLHGLLLVIERPFLALFKTPGPAVQFARISVVFLCVTMLWVFFRLPNFDHALAYLHGMFTPTTNPNPTKLFYNLALLYSLPVMIQHLSLGALVSTSLRRWEPYLYGALAALAFLDAGPDAAFIYFQF